MCVCCREIDCVVAKNNEAIKAEGLAEPPVCIIQQTWVSGCLFDSLGSTDGMVSVQAAVRGPLWRPWAQKNGNIAYRQLARWCWGVLGKDIRVTLPSCAVCCIRAHFPPPGIKEDFTFEEFRFADEWKWKQHITKHWIYTKIHILKKQKVHNSLGLNFPIFICHENEKH